MDDFNFFDRYRCYDKKQNQRLINRNIKKN